VFLNDEYLRFLRNTVGVATMCLSVSDVLDPAVNAELMGTPAKLRVDIEALCAEIKRYDFNLRLSLNMTDAYEQRLGRARRPSMRCSTGRKRWAPTSSRFASSMPPRTRRCRKTSGYASTAPRRP